MTGGLPIRITIMAALGKPLPKPSPACGSRFQTDDRPLPFPSCITLLCSAHVAHAGTSFAGTLLAWRCNGGTNKRLPKTELSDNNNSCVPSAAHATHEIFLIFCSVGNCIIIFLRSRKNCFNL